MRIAHLSDLHILDTKGVGPRHFLNRRLVGGANIVTLRRDAHSAAIFERLLEDLLDEEPDHVVITGDVSNLALPSEFERVAAYLRMLWDYERVSLVPGNHDYYTPGAIRDRRFEKAFHPYMFADFTDLDVSLYPYVKHLGPVTLLGLCSATLNPPAFAWGEVDEEQMARLVRLVHEPSVRRTFKIVLLHHHFHLGRSKTAFTSRLRNRDELETLLVENGVDLVLHGHDHIAHVGWLRSGDRRVPAIGAGSSTATDPRPDRIARYNVYTIERGRLRNVEVRRYDDATRRFGRVDGRPQRLV